MFVADGCNRRVFVLNVEGQILCNINNTDVKIIDVAWINDEDKLVLLDSDYSVHVYRIQYGEITCG